MRVSGFQPDTAGWRAAFASDRYIRVEPLAGWVVEETTIRAAVVVGGDVVPVGCFPDFWRLVGPGEPVPTEYDYSVHTEALCRIEAEQTT